MIAKMIICQIHSVRLYKCKVDAYQWKDVQVHYVDEDEIEVGNYMPKRTELKMTEWKTV